jgi:hypothetical protein
MLTFLTLHFEILVSDKSKSKVKRTAWEWIDLIASDLNAFSEEDEDEQEK